MNTKGTESEVDNKPDKVEQKSSEGQPNNLNVQMIIVVRKYNNIAEEKTYQINNKPWNKKTRCVCFNPRQAENVDGEEDPHNKQFRRDEKLFSIGLFRNIR